jgi:hypothetical protein
MKKKEECRTMVIAITRRLRKSQCGVCGPAFGEQGRHTGVKTMHLFNLFFTFSRGWLAGIVIGRILIQAAAN